MLGEAVAVAPRETSGEAARFEQQQLVQGADPPDLDRAEVGVGAPQDQVEAQRLLRLGRVEDGEAAFPGRPPCSAQA